MSLDSRMPPCQFCGWIPCTGRRLVIDCCCPALTLNLECQHCTAQLSASMWIMGGHVREQMTWQPFSNFHVIYFLQGCLSSFSRAGRLSQRPFDTWETWSVVDMLFWGRIILSIASTAVLCEYMQSVKADAHLVRVSVTTFQIEWITYVFANDRSGSRPRGYNFDVCVVENVVQVYNLVKWELVSFIGSRCCAQGNQSHDCKDGSGLI